VNRYQRPGALAVVALLASCAAASTNPPAPGALSSGIDTLLVDKTVRPQDDFYRHVNGKWLDTTAIPPDKAVWGSFNKLDEDAQVALREIIEASSKNPSQPGSEARKIGDLYASFMDEARLESLGLKPLQPELAAIDAILDMKGIAATIGRLARLGVGAPYSSSIHADHKDSTKYVVYLSQSGLGLPDRDYYLKSEDAKLKDMLAKYEAHVTRVLSLAGDANAEGDARSIVGLETALAKVQWTKVENRDPQRTYNKLTLEQLGALAPDNDWKSFLVATGIDGRIDYLIVRQPSYLSGFNQVLKETPLPIWKAYLRWHLLLSYSEFVSKAFVDENFAFYGTTLRGVPQNQPRWKRGVEAVKDSIGEGLGKIYVARHFPPANKARMEALVANLLKAYQQSIDTLVWMSPETKKEAQAKLAKFTPKIGYPNKWRDYSALAVASEDLVGNIERAHAFEFDRNVNKLGKPIDRDEWGMTPQTVNAYYNAELNEIVFPAAILQPPFFNALADDAVNYGGIGAVIGHEISHGFDDQGSKYDGNGNLRDWWTPADHERFAAKTKALVAQYSAQEPVPGYHVNGELTLGENIADNSGMAIAYKAYRLSLHDTSASVVDGLTGDQRFFMGWAQVWRAKIRENEAIRRIMVDPHSPAPVRGSVALKNQSAFFDAFSIQPGDKMYVPTEQRIIIW
jgi:predicted metalloendopeptidase